MSRTAVVQRTLARALGMRSPIRAPLKWETAATYSRAEYVDTPRGLYLASRVNAALASTAPATALNPFGGRDYRQPAAVIEPLSTEAWFGARADLLIVDAQVAGTLFRLPTGLVQGAVCAEQRRERFSSVSDSASRAGDILGTGQLGADAHLSRRAWAIAAELAAPFVAARPGDTPGPLLAVEAAARVEEFSESFSSGVKPSVGLVARPARDVMRRASVAWTFRAPTLPQLFAPQSDTYYNSVPDPRRPAALTGDDNDGPNVPRLVRQGGNPQLTPETGRALQAGATWSPRAVAGLSFEGTWFRYEFEDLISGVSPVYVLEHELGGLGALVHRASGTQTFINRTSAPIAVLTGPNGATTAVAPGQSASVPGRITRVDTFTINLSRRLLDGWDFGVRHGGGFAGGRATAGAGATYTHKTGGAYDRLTPIVNNAGGSGAPRWRGRFALDWKRGAWATGATMAHIASSGYHSATGYYLKPYRTVQLRAAYTTRRESWPRGTQFALGIDDVFDESPPLFLDHPIGFQYGTISRPQGRFWRVTVKRTW